MTKRGRGILVALFVATTVTAIGIRAKIASADVVLRFFDVGQGDAAMLSLDRTQVLIDAGPDRGVLAKLGHAMPLFDRRIELAVLTHPHADHFMGFLGIFERYDVSRVIVSGAESASSDYRAFAEAAEHEGAEIVRVHKGDIIELGDNIRFNVLWSSPEPQPEDPNDASVVLRLEAHNSSALFMGDAGFFIEDALLGSKAPLKADVLKVGHHGSRTASGAAFLAAVKPTQAIISSGKNSYGHPSAAAMSRLQAVGAEIKRTDLDGDITIRFRPRP